MQLRNLIGLVFKEALTWRERRVIEMRYGFTNEGKLTLQEIGDRLQCTKGNVGHIIDGAIKKIRNPKYLTVIKDIWEWSNI